jgi:hypothetical protein
VNTGAMLARMTFGLDLAAGRMNGARVDPALLQRSGGDPAALLGVLLPGRDAASLAGKIARELDREAAAPRQRAQRALGLALGSPEFQRR